VPQAERLIRRAGEPGLKISIVAQQHRHAARSDGLEAHFHDPALLQGLAIEAYAG
jgi:hypothetical protein